MPDHLHALLYQDNDKTSVPDFMRDLKRETSKRLKIPDYPGSKLWLERYDDVPVPGKDAVIVKLRYMLYNPVRRGLVDDPQNYPWSSAKEHYDIGTGIVTVERI
jgi:putative transposase